MSLTFNLNKFTRKYFSCLSFNCCQWLIQDGNNTLSIFLLPHGFHSNTQNTLRFCCCSSSPSLPYQMNQPNTPSISIQKKQTIANKHPEIIVICLPTTVKQSKKQRRSKPDQWRGGNEYQLFPPSLFPVELTSQTPLKIIDVAASPIPFDPTVSSLSFSQQERNGDSRRLPPLANHRHHRASSTQPPTFLLFLMTDWSNHRQTTAMASWCNPRS